MQKAFLTFLLFFITVIISAQTQKFGVGIKVTNDLTFYHGWAGGFGAQTTYLITKHSGIESGLQFTSRENWYIYGSVAIIKQKEQRLLLPLLYRFESGTLNFTAGPVLDFLINTKDIEKLGSVDLIDYSWKTFRLISSASVSKSINLSKSIVLEPEIRFNYIILDRQKNDGSLGLNLAIRKLF